MTIKYIKFENFKSFDSLELELSNFNVVIGSNASGKSNLIQAFKFLKDIAHHGLEDAISIQGGVDFLRNNLLSKSKELHFQVKLDEKVGITLLNEDDHAILARSKEVDYSFSLKFNKSRLGYVITSDKINVDSEFIEITAINSKHKREEKNIGAGTVEITKKSGNFNVKIDGLDGYNIDIDAIVKRMTRFMDIFGTASKPLLKKSLMMELSLFILYPGLDEILKNTMVYDFDPKLPRKGVSISGTKILEEDGNNLALVLKEILDDKEKKRKFYNLVKDLLPFVDEYDIENNSDKSLLFSLKEVYSKDKKLYLPASFLSEGTINITGLIVALYFNESRISQRFGVRPLIIIEEPEKNIHPGLASKVVKLMMEAADKRQIIVTTHSPQVVKHAGLNNLILISKNKDGFSVIQRPDKSEMVQEFIKNQIGIDELFTSSLLGE